MEDRTIKRVGAEKCTGCGACYNKCPVHAISMEYDEEGFLSPIIDGTKCVKCGLCKQICPALNKDLEQDNNSDKKECFAVVADDEIRKVSSSGGAFSLLAEFVLDRNGYVCGVTFNDDFKKAQHIIISSKKELYRLRGSKYVQSDTNTVYTQIKKLLDEDKWVLFSGCSCQNMGLKYFLGREYSKLILVDIICHGVPSPKVYERYLEELEKGRKITKVDFREKKYWGWGTASSIWFDDEKVYRKDCNTDVYWKAFLGGLSTRKACGECPYANPYLRGGDITIGDFWGIPELLPKLNDNQGVSLVMTNTVQGENIFKQIKNASEEKSSAMFYKLNMDEVIDLCKCRNGQFIAPKTPHWARKRFFELISSKGVFTAFDEATNSKYDVGIVGWWNNQNYGGILTYYALHQVLKNMELSVLMIRHIRWKSEENPPMESIAYRFATKNYYISRNYRREELRILNNHCKAFISGSDQLFNPSLWDYTGKEYFLEFANMDRNLISYASSFGNGYDINNKHHMNISYWLHRFNALSVREDYGVDICKDGFGLESKLVMDPVFLCDISEYEKLIRKTNLQKENPYLLNFILDPNEQKRQAILNTSKKLKLKYLNLVNADNFKKNAEMLNLDNTKAGIDVEEWLFYYKNADFIITDSFHGTCFAIIFRKPFISIANKQRGANRFVSVLKIAGLEDRLVYDVNQIPNSKKLFEPIDYEQVYARLNPKIKESLEWLKNAIFNKENAGKDLFKLFDYQLRLLQDKK